MKRALKRVFLSLMILTLPALSIGCDVDIDDDFFEDGYLTDAIYATGDAISQVIFVSGEVWGPYIPLQNPQPSPHGHP